MSKKDFKKKKKREEKVKRMKRSSAIRSHGLSEVDKKRGFVQIGIFSIIVAISIIFIFRASS